MKKSAIGDDSLRNLVGARVSLWLQRNGGSGKNNGIVEDSKNLR